MADAIPSLRILDRLTEEKHLNLISELFHQVNRIIPTNQKVLMVPPTCLVRDAIAMMRKHHYSQIPVTRENGEVLGVFSFRSFAKYAGSATLEELNGQKCAPADLRVDDFLEDFKFTRVTEEMDHVIEDLDRDNGILIGSPDKLVGIITPMDFLNYLYRVASPYVMIWEIELALRALIRSVMSEARIADAARRCLLAIYKEVQNVPTTLEEMTFDNYQLLVSHGENWPLFAPLFGGTRNRLGGLLREIGDLRNDIFHFKRVITLEDHETLSSFRGWLLSKSKQIEPRRVEER